MSGEDTKKSIAGALMQKHILDDRKPSPAEVAAAAAAAAAPPAPPKKVIIKSADMLPEMQREAVDIAVTAFEKYNVEKDVAEQIKKEFDRRHGPTWHCIVGRNFAAHLPPCSSHLRSSSSNGWICNAHSSFKAAGMSCGWTELGTVPFNTPR